MRFLITGIIMMSLCFIGYGYQKITQGAQVFEDEIRPQMRYPLTLDEGVTLTYAEVKGFTLLYNIDIAQPFTVEGARQYHHHWFGAFRDTRYCHPVTMVAYSHVAILIRLYYLNDNKEMLFKDDFFYLCGVTIIGGGNK